MKILAQVHLPKTIGEIYSRRTTVSLVNAVCNTAMVASFNIDPAWCTL
jgi:hypothetical protein